MLDFDLAALTPNFDDQGLLTRKRVHLVRSERLAERAALLGLDGWVLLGPSEEMSRGRERSALFKLAMRNVGMGGGSSAESDLFSYLLFDGEFVEPLTELGYRDAAAREDELVRFFTD